MFFSTRLLVLALLATVFLSAPPVVSALEVDPNQDTDEDGVPTATSEVSETSEEKDFDDVDVPEEEESEEESQGGLVTKMVLLGNKTVDYLPAGESVDCLVTLANVDDTNHYTVGYVVGSLYMAGDESKHVQNFTVNEYFRAISPKETGSFKYSFTPHVSLEPQDYNLVMNVYVNTQNNETSAVPVYNGTITVTEAPGTDPKTFLTFGTIAVIIGGAVYYYQSRRPNRRPVLRSAKKASSTVEMGTGASYDKEWVSDDHLRYAAAVSKSQSPKRK